MFSVPEALLIADRNTIRLMIEELKQEAAEKDRMIAEMDVIIAQKEAEIVQKETEIMQKDINIKDMEKSLA